MIKFRCQQCDCNTRRPVIRDGNSEISLETASDHIMKMLDSGKNTREIAEITGLPLQNINSLIVERIKI